MTDERVPDPGCEHGKKMIWVAELEYEGDTFTVDWRAFDALVSELTSGFESEEERTYTVRFKQMSREHLDSLPEFEGF